MKKLIAMLVAVLIAASLPGCGMVVRETVSTVKDLTRTTEPGATYLSESDELGYVTDGAEGGGSGAYIIELPDDFNTEEYAKLDENGFVSVALNPFSTFSADIDTASYCNLRRMIREGLPLEDIPNGAVRIEEMLNYFKYDYQGPEGNDLFGVNACIADCPWNPDTKLLVLGLQTERTEMVETQGNNLVFLIDTSGSMDSPDKLELLQKSFSFLVDQLDPRDTVSIVTYSGSERVVLDGVQAKDRWKILRAVNSLEAEGCTNGQSGLARAYDLAEKHFIEGGNNRIILASDGDLNVGITSESDLSDYVSQKREMGVYLSVLGFGTGNYKDTKMETIADDGNGAYYYIDCLDEAERVFGEDLCATMFTIANDVKLQLEFNPAYVKGYRQVGYENRALDDDEFKDDTVDAGEVGVGHSVTVAYEIVLNDSAQELTGTDSRYGNTNAAGVENGEWFALNVRYKPVTDAGVGEAVENHYAFGEKDYTDNPTEDWIFASQVISFGMLARGSEFAGNLDLGDLCEQVQAYSNGFDFGTGAVDERRAEFAELVLQSAGVVEWAW